MVGWWVYGVLSQVQDLCQLWEAFYEKYDREVDDVWAKQVDQIVPSRNNNIPIGQEQIILVIFFDKVPHHVNILLPDDGLHIKPARKAYITLAYTEYLSELACPLPCACP